MKRTATPLIIIFLILGFLSVQTSADLSASQLEVQTNRSVEIIRPRVHSLDRDLVTFHYENNARAGAVGLLRNTPNGLS